MRRATPLRDNARRAAMPRSRAVRPSARERLHTRVRLLQIGPGREDARQQWRVCSPLRSSPRITSSDSPSCAAAERTASTYAGSVSAGSDASAPAAATRAPESSPAVRCGPRRSSGARRRSFVAPRLALDHRFGAGDHLVRDQRDPSGIAVTLPGRCIMSTRDPSRRLPPILCLRPTEAAPEDRVVEPELSKDLRHLSDMAEEIRQVADRHRCAERSGDPMAEREVPDERFAADEKLVRASRTTGPRAAVRSV